MKGISVLDVTLRDGGCVNDFNFGRQAMERILHALEESGVENIELGYLDAGRGSFAGRTQFRSEQVIPRSLLKKKKPGVRYMAMMDYGRFDPEQLKSRTEEGIDGIRLAFHKENRYEIFAAGRAIMEKGFRLFLQPMVTLRYSDAELAELIGLVNRELPDAAAFYLVDSFGGMEPGDVSRLLKQIDQLLDPNVALGFHSHNNRGLSYTNALVMLELKTGRDRLLDCSMMGMGKGAGNLSTELVLEHLNCCCGGHYRLLPVLEAIESEIRPLHREYNWGCSPEFRLSAEYHCSPGYASRFCRDYGLSLQETEELLSRIPEEKRNSFDPVLAQALYGSMADRR